MAIVRLDKVAGIHLESVQAPAGGLKNGYFVELGGLVAGETELRVATTPSDVENGDIVLHATAEVDPDPRRAGLKHFEVEAGEAGRAYRLVKGDIVTLTEDLFEDDAQVTVGATLAPVSGSFKLGEIAEGQSPAIQVKVIQETTLGYDAQTAYAVQVVKA